jgi:pyruvate dehydrogenase E1 component beta subunit
MAILNEGCFFELDAPPRRVTALNVPVPYNHHLEAAAIPDTDWVVKAVLEMFGK